jgi:hypothetical protein
MSLPNIDLGYLSKKAQRNEKKENKLYTKETSHNQGIRVWNEFT